MHEINLNLQAQELNNKIKKLNPLVFDLLSQKGRSAYFPKDGILAQTSQAKGTKINATIGIAFEEDGTPMRFSSIAGKINIAPQDVFPYAPSFGKPDLRSKWLETIKLKNPSLQVPTSTPVVTAALTHGLYITGYLFVDPGDRIILPDKFWGNYRLVFTLGFGAVLDTFPTFRGNGFDTVSLENKIKSNKSKKLILLFNFPNNPAGYTPTEKEARAICRIVKKEAYRGRKILVICDDAYFGLVYKKGVFTQSLLSLLAGLDKNIFAVKLDAATKEEFVWGFRVGFITFAGKNISPETYLALEDKTAGTIRGTISNAPHLCQSLVLASLSSPKHNQEKRQKYRILKKRFLKVEHILKKNVQYRKFFHSLPFNSGYFMCLELEKGIEAEKVRLYLLKKFDTGTIALPGNLLRIAYSSVPLKNLEKLFANIYQACLVQVSCNNN